MSTPTAIRIILQDGTLLISRALSMPAGGKASAWVMGVGPLGFRVWHDGTVDVDCGVANNGPVGAVFYQRIEVDYSDTPRVLPRKGWRVQGNMLVLGETPGGDVLAGRQCFRIRTTNGYSARAATDTFHIGRIGIRLPVCMKGLDAWRHDRLLACLKNGTADSYGADVWSANLGPYHPLGEAIAGEGGGFGIETVSGWNGDALLDILRADLTLERNHLSCVDKDTGNPLPSSKVACPNYSGSRGWFKSGQLDAWCDLFDPTNPYDDRRKPKTWNAGSAAYFNALCGVDFYSDFQPANFEHLIRAMYHARAAAQIYADEPSKHTLAMIAQDTAYTNTWKDGRVNIGFTAGQGSGVLGRRECAWVIVATGSRDIAAACAVAAMPTGIVQNCKGPWSGWIPDPSLEQVTIPYGTTTPKHWPPCKPTDGVFQLYEEVMLRHAMVQTGRTDIATKATASIYEGSPSWMKTVGYLPKFAVVSENGVPRTTLGQAVDWQDYTPFMGLGLMAHIDRARWLPHFLDIGTPTMGKGSTLAEQKAKMIADLPGRSQLVAALSALEAGGY